MTTSSQPNLVSRRMLEKMSTDRSQLDKLLAGTVLAHVATIVDGRAVAMPTECAEIDGRIVIHGSTGSRWLRALLNTDATVTVTKLSGLVVARSLFESSVLYESAMIFGRFTKVAAEHTDTMLLKLSERLLPGRPAETRPSLKKELAATMLLQMEITDWSLRVSADMPDDPPVDVAGDTWAGHIVFDGLTAHAVAAPDLADGIAVPASVENFLDNPRGII